LGDIAKIEILKDIAKMMIIRGVNVVGCKFPTNFVVGTFTIQPPKKVMYFLLCEKHVFFFLMAHVVNP
jgi:hypothetical protein